MTSKRKLDNWIQSYLQYTQDSQSPLQFHFWTAVSTIAGALRRHVFFDQVLFKWHPNFYIVFVAKPGVANKSTTIDVGMRLLSKIEGVFFGPESVTWQALVQQLASSRSIVDYGNNTDPIPQCAITLSVGEFGTFFNAKDHVMTDHLTSLWDCKLGRFTKKTKTSGEDQIDNPFINLISGTTPDWIQSNFTEYMIGGGFMSRCIFVYGNEPRKLVPYLKEREIHDREAQDKRQSELEQNLIDDLYSISELRGEFKLSDEAYDFGYSWYTELHTKTPEHLRDPNMGGYLQRKQTHVHKLAMILSVAEGGSLVLEKKHLQAAITITDGLEKDLPKIFNAIGGSVEAGVTTVIWQFLIAHGAADKGIIYEKFSHKFKGQILDQSLQSLLTAGKIKVKGMRNNQTIYEAVVK